MQKKLLPWWNITSVVALALMCVLLGGGIAAALWSAKTSHPVSGVATGEAKFFASPENNGAKNPVVYSKSGEAVEIKIPAAKIIESLGAVPPGSEPIIWRFTIAGSAPGIAGINYTVRASEQFSEEGRFKIVDGIAQPGTLLAQSIVKVYPAGTGGDCSGIPMVPEELKAAANIFVSEGSDVVLQEPGAGMTPSTQKDDWCVALQSNWTDEGLYAKNVFFRGTSEDGSGQDRFALRDSRVDISEPLIKLGLYRSQVIARGTTDAGDQVSDTHRWGVNIYAYPDDEPALVLSISPRLTAVVAP